MNDQIIKELYDRAQQADRDVDALRFALHSESDTARKLDLQARINVLAQKASDLWVEHCCARDAQRAANTAARAAATSPAAMPAASVKPAPVTPAPSAAEIAQRRRAETRDLWRRVIGQINAEMFGSQPDGRKTPSTAAPAGNSQKPKSNPSSREVWKRAVAAANAGIAGGEPSASRERHASSNGRPQASSEEFLSKSMATAGKQLEQAGFKVM